MDKAKEIGALLLKYHFWILCVLVLAVGVFSWRSVRAQMEEQVAARSSKINSAHDRVQRVSSTPNHPNESFQEGVGAKQVQLESEIFQAWQTLYNDQKEVLTWPEDLPAPFLDFVTNEAYQQLPKNERPDIPLKLRENYRDYASDALPALFEIVEPLAVREEEDPEAEPDANGQRAMRVVQEGKVQWAQADRDRIAGMYKYGQTPSTVRILLAQEDYWIYKALLQIIADTNANAGGYADATVKQINKLAIAQEATSEPRVDVKYIEDATKGHRMSTGDGKKGSSMDGDETSDLELQRDRYVDASGTPLASANSAPFSEFNMMPVLMELVVDQRRLPELMANCANSPLPVEIRHVTIEGMSAGEEGEGGGGGSRGGGMSMPANRSRGGMKMPGRAGGAPGGATSRPGGRGADAGLGIERGPYDADVEIRGIIYIFNPPDLKKLGQGAAQFNEAGEVVAADEAAAADDTATGVDATEAAAEPIEAPPAPADAGAEP